MTSNRFNNKKLKFNEKNKIIKLFSNIKIQTLKISLSVLAKLKI